MRRRTAAYRIRPDYKAAVSVMARDDQMNVGETLEHMIAGEMEQRYGNNWRDVVRVRINDDGGIIVDPLEEE